MAKTTSDPEVTPIADEEYDPMSVQNERAAQNAQDQESPFTPIADFGYDSKLVVKWLETFGIPKTTARDNTKQLREEIDAKRDAEILRLKGEGLSNVAIGKTVGCAEGTVRTRLDALASQNERAAKTTSEEDTPIADEEYDPMTHGFDDEE